MKALLSRRALLAGGVLAAAIPAGMLAIHSATPRAEIVIDYLRRAFPGLAVSDTDMATFAQTYLSEVDPENKRKAQYDRAFLLLAHPSLRGAAWKGLRDHAELLSRTLTTNFLMSTNFFGAAGQRPERTSYVAFADPYTVGCRNPIARFDA